MIYFLFFLFFNYTASLEVEGLWPSSLPYYQAKEFFDFAFPQFKNIVDEVLTERDSKHEIISKLKNSETPNIVLGFLNLSLSFGLFNSKASIKYPQFITSNKSKLSGWWAERSQKLSKFDIQTAQARIYSTAYSKTDSLHYFTELSRNFDKMIDSFSSTPQNNRIIHFLPNEMVGNHSSINGRTIVSNTPHEIVHILLQEMRNYEIMSKIDIPRKILYSEPCLSVPTFTKLLKVNQPLYFYDYNKYQASLPKNLKITSNPIDFLKFQKPLITIEVFLSLKNPSESKALLEDILKYLRSPTPIEFFINLIGDLDNPLEKQIIYSYLFAIDYLGTYNAAEYLFDGFRYGWRKAYEFTYPPDGIHWNKIPILLYNRSNYQIKINKTLKYIQKNKILISQTAASVNGIFITEKPIFREIEPKVIEVASLLQKYFQKGLFIDDDVDEMFEWQKKHWIYFNRRMPNINISSLNLLSFNSISISVIIELLTSISPLYNFSEHIPSSKTQTIFSSGYHKNNTGFSIQDIPVIILSNISNDYQKNYIETIYNNLSKIYSFYSCNIFKLSETLRKTLRNSQMIVGNLLFDHFLSKEELDFVVEYVAKKYAYDDLSDMEFVQMFYILLWRGSQELEGAIRSEPPNNISPYTMIYNVNHPIEWVISIDPLSEEFREIGYLAEYIRDCQAAKISLTPICQKALINYPYPNWFKEFIPCIDVENINIDTSWDIHLPKYWSGFAQNDSIIVTQVIQYGFSSSLNFTIKNEGSYYVDKNGYFLIASSLGRKKLFNVAEKFIDFDTLYPIPHLITKPESYITIIPKSNIELNVALFFDQSTKFKSLIQSFINTTSLSNIRFYIFYNSFVPNHDFIFLNNKKIDFVEMPQFWRQNANWIKSGKFALLDLILPIDFGCEKVLVLDQNAMMVKDTKAFVNLDMKTSKSALSAPIISSDDSWSDNPYWNTFDMKKMRLGRNYLSSKLVLFDMNQWRKERGGDLYRRMLINHQWRKYFSNDEDETIMNYIQLKIQTITLPAETVYDYHNSPKKDIEKAFCYIPE